MANVRVVSFAAEGIVSPTAPFTFLYRLNTDKKWFSRGLYNTQDLQRAIETDLDSICTLATRTLLRIDNGSGLEISIPDILEIIERETVLGQGRLKCLNIVAYPTSPFPQDAVIEKKEFGCCAVQ